MRKWSEPKKRFTTGSKHRHMKRLTIPFLMLNATLMNFRLVSLSIQCRPSIDGVEFTTACESGPDEVRAGALETPASSLADYSVIHKSGKPVKNNSFYPFAEISHLLRFCPLP